MEEYDKSWVCELQKQPEALEFHQLYSVKQKIGAGTYGKVLVAKHRDQEHGAYAAKVLETTTEATYLAWAIEWQILKTLGGHWNIVNLINVFFLKARPRQRPRQSSCLSFAIETFTTTYSATSQSKTTSSNCGQRICALACNTSINLESVTGI